MVLVMERALNRTTESVGGEDTEYGRETSTSNQEHDSIPAGTNASGFPVFPEGADHSPRLVFEDSEKTKWKRRDYTHMLHPFIRTAIERKCSELFARDLVNACEDIGITIS